MNSHNSFARRAVPLSRFFLFTLLALLVLAIGFSLIVNAAAGDLDTSFSTDGRQTTDFFRDYDVILDLALQRDGKIVAFGYATRAGHTDFALARYNTNGSLDLTFSGDGKQTTDFVGDDIGRGIAIQSNGKIVVAGYSTNSVGQRDFALARYNSNGTLDTTFSSDGRVKTDFFGARDGAYAVAIQSDGKIVAVGRAETAPGSTFYDYAIARYNSNGSLDTTFDTDGKVTTDFFGSNDFAHAVRIQSDHKIVVGGDVYNQSANLDFAVARYNSNGALDTTFSLDGKTNTDFGRSTDLNTAMVIQPDNKIVLTGYSQTSTGYRLVVSRYKTNGSLDTTFSGDGRQITLFTGAYHNGFGYDLDLHSNGKIVVIGTTCDDSFVCDVALVRYNPNGTPDTSFSGDGKLTADFGTDDNAYAGALQSNGRIIAAGTVGPTDLTTSKYDFLVARFLSDPALTASPSESNISVEGADSNTHQMSATPVAPIGDRNNILLDANPGAKKLAARRHLEKPLPEEDPMAESEW